MALDLTLQAEWNKQLTALWVFQHPSREEKARLQHNGAPATQQKPEGKGSGLSSLGKTPSPSYRISRARSLAGVLQAKAGGYVWTCAHHGLDVSVRKSLWKEWKNKNINMQEQNNRNEYIVIKFKNTPMKFEK